MYRVASRPGTTEAPPPELAVAAAPPAGHGQQRPARRPQLPPLERRRAGGDLPEEVRRAVHLHGHLAPAVENDRVYAVALRRAHLLLQLHGSAQLKEAERLDHVALQLRGPTFVCAEGGVAAARELGRQLRPSLAALNHP
eukprot:scaffold10794_cov66-Phaeocystis_antarctica.AAC.5